VKAIFLSEAFAASFQKPRSARPSSVSAVVHNGFPLASRQKRLRLSWSILSSPCLFPASSPQYCWVLLLGPPRLFFCFFHSMITSLAVMAVPVGRTLIFLAPNSRIFPRPARPSASLPGFPLFTLTCWIKRLLLTLHAVLLSFPSPLVKVKRPPRQVRAGPFDFLHRNFRDVSRSLRRGVGYGCSSSFTGLHSMVRSPAPFSLFRIYH